MSALTSMASMVSIIAGGNMPLGSARYHKEKEELPKEVQDAKMSAAEAKRERRCKRNKNG